MGDYAATVMAIYEAFGRGDAAFILDQLEDDVRWDEGIRPTSLPYLVPGRGKDHVLGFFQALASEIEFLVFEPGTPCVGGDTVIVPVREVARHRGTGQVTDEDLVAHVWTFGPDGKVVAFRHIVDLAPHERIAAGQPASLGATAG